MSCSLISSVIPLVFLGFFLILEKVIRNFDYTLIGISTRCPDAFGGNLFLFLRFILVKIR